MVTRVFCTQENADRITVFQMDPDSGKLTVEREFDMPGGPAPLAVDPQQRWLVVGLREQTGLATVRLNPYQGLGEMISKIDLPVDACYVSVDHTGRFVLSAYYGAGVAAVHRISDDGVLVSEAVQWIETTPHAHCIHTDPSNRFAYLPHTMPANTILQYAFDADSGRLTPLAMLRAAVEEGVGPRHYCYHPDLYRVYVSNENGSSVTSYAMDLDTGQLDLLQTLSTLPSDYEGDNTCAQIHMTPNGRWLYVSNRGHDSLAIFGIAADTGMLTPAGHRDTQPIPRVFGIDPTGRFLYAAGLGSDRLSGYTIDDDTGQLDEFESYGLGRTPMWILALEMDSEE
jgi:6-phosphogluconolactonase